MPNHKFLKLILIALPIVLLVLVLLTIFLSNKNSNQVATDTQPTPTVNQPAEAPFNPSKWAGDEEVINIENQITTLETDLGNMDLRLQQILPPDLDMAVKF